MDDQVFYETWITKQRAKRKQFEKELADAMGYPARVARKGVEAVAKWVSPDDVVAAATLVGGYKAGLVAKGVKRFYDRVTKSYSRFHPRKRRTYKKKRSYRPRYKRHYYRR